MKMIFICEVCGKTATISPEEAHCTGWDYPPFHGNYGEVSPRTCPECSMLETAWAALVIEKKSYSELNDKQRETIHRIQGEPENMIPTDHSPAD